MKLFPDERIDDLNRTLPDGTKLGIIQNKNWFCFGIDAVVLSEFADIKPNDEVMDLGTGTGIIPILVSAKKNPRYIDALEICKNVCDMAKRSVIMNNLEDKINVINADLVGYKSDKQYDCVICNPPYKKINTGILNEKEELLIARHEFKCCLSDVLSTASRILKPLGRFSMIHRPERLVDIMCLMREKKLEPKRIRYVYSNIKKPPVMVMVEGRKCAKPYIKTEPPLLIYKNDGTYTDEVYEIYK